MNENENGNLNGVITMLCISRESSKFLCDRIAVYMIDGSGYCWIHGRRLILGGVKNERE